MMLEKVPRWESELWSYISSSDGEHCPLHYDCQVRLQDHRCLNDSKRHLQHINTLLDNDEFILGGSGADKLDFIRCAEAGRIFQLVEKLAHKYLKMGNLHSPPVPAVLVALCDKTPIEVREVPLKAYHGAIWRLRNSWIIHLNENDTPARKKFSLFHEAFHILAHSKATPVFRKIGFKQGSFNELLADHFAGCILMPPEWAREKWAEVHDLDQMAEIFQIPKPVVWFGLKGMGLI